VERTTARSVHCRNFVAVRDSEYPQSFTKLLARLGISDKEAEISELGPGDDPNTRLYGGWYHFVGQIERNPGVEIAFPATAAGKSAWHVDFCVSQDLALKAFDQQPLVQLNFRASLAWVLAEPPD